MFKLSSVAILLFSACASDGMDGMDGTDRTDRTDGTDGANGSNGSSGQDGEPAPELAPPGVYTLANQTTGNRVASYLRGENGNLTRDQERSTGGTGTGAGLGTP